MQLGEMPELLLLLPRRSGIAKVMKLSLETKSAGMILMTAPKYQLHFKRLL